MALNYSMVLIGYLQRLTNESCNKNSLKFIRRFVFWGILLSFFLNDITKLILNFKIWKTYDIHKNYLCKYFDNFLPTSRKKIIRAIQVHPWLIFSSALFE